MNVMSKLHLVVQDEVAACKTRLDLLWILFRDMPIIVDSDDFTNDMREDFREFISAEIKSISTRLDSLQASLRLLRQEEPVSD